MSSVLELIAKRNTAQQRRVVEGKKGEIIDVPEVSGLLVTGCTGCTVNAPGRSGNVTLERCDGTSLRAGCIVASLEVIHCKDVKVSAKRYDWRVAPCYRGIQLGSWNIRKHTI